jgi:carbon storage regulator
MLVLTRRPGEAIVIASNIKITVVSAGPGRVKIGIDAPPNVRIHRQELLPIEPCMDGDVLSGLGEGELTTTDAQNTVVVHGPDTATIEIGSSAGAAESEPAGAALPNHKMGYYRLPRKSR